MSKDAIVFFREEFAFLSNFHPAIVHFRGLEFPSVENAFQAAKNSHPKYRVAYQTVTPLEAKRMGTGGRAKLRPDWEQEKDGIMEELLRKKFENVPLRTMILDTGDRELSEGNWWHDNEWGDCICSKCVDLPADDKLGKLLMKIRADLKVK